MAGDRQAVTYFVRYQGLPAPMDRFLAHYRGPHAALLQDFPGIRGLTVHTPAEATDPQATNADPTSFLAEMTFDDLNALRAALDSEARRRAREDFANLDVGGATVTHQAMVSERLF